MKDNELRIGNLVTDEFYESFKTIIKVESINDKGIDLQINDDGNYPECASRWIEPYCTFESLRPIPLTEEWLLRFGFELIESVGHKYYHIDLGDSYLYFNTRDNEFGLAITNLDEESDTQELSHALKIQHVHQLQNLYFALTGEELNENDH